MIERESSIKVEADDREDHDALISTSRSGCRVWRLLLDTSNSIGSDDETSKEMIH